MKISICIPTWEQHGKGPRFIIELFNSIKNQTFSDFNVIVSDHSLNDDIEKICLSYQNFFEIKYFRNPIKYGNGPANTNFSIKFADGEIIKIMFQDDFFYENNSLMKIHEQFEKKPISWLVCGCNHTHDDGKTFTNQLIPYWNEKIPFGVNTISSPSVLSFRNNSKLYFDENLVLLMDCEIYYQFYMKFGEPEILKDILVTNRCHDLQISAQYTDDVQQEINYICNKHSIRY